MSRRDAAGLAAAAGCDVVDYVNKKTTILVVGQQDLKKLHGHEKSKKHRAAEDLAVKRGSIRIIGEHDFLALVD